MKNMKTHLTRLLVVFTLITVLLSATLIPSFAAPAGSDPVLSGSEYGISYDNGVYTLSIDAERLAEILSSKSFDKETLRSVMPEAVYNLFLNRDAESVKALLADLSKNASLGQLKEDLPIDYVINSFTTEELIGFTYLDKLLEREDIIDAILHDDAVLTDIAHHPEITVALVANPVIANILVAHGADDFDNVDFNSIVNALSDEERTIIVEEIKDFPDVQDKIAEAVQNDFTLIVDAVKASGLSLEEIKNYINLSNVKESLIAKVSKFVLSDLWAVSINGDDIDNVIFHNGSFDLAKFEKSLLDAIPTFDKIAAMGDDGEAASFVVHYMIKVGEEYKEYYNGFKIVFTGDTTAIKDYAAKMTEYVSFVVGDDGSITAKIGAPAKIAELYVSAIDSAKLPAALRAKLADIANIEFNKSDIGAFGDAIINKLTIAEIKDLLSSVDIKNIDDKILEQLDLRKSQVQLILDYATKAINKGVSIIETSPEIELTLGSFYDKTLADFYVGNGTFEFDFDISIDVMEKLDKIEKLPAEAKNLIKNATIAHSVNATIEINGLYEVEYVKGDEVIYTAYRTEGYDLGKVTANSAFAGLGANGWAGADAVAVTTMPAEDIQLAEIFNATFAAYDADGNLISETVIPFTQLSDVNSLLVAPSMPTIDGYIFIWDDINVVYDNFTVEGRYVETDDDVYTATFWDGSRVLFTLQYTAADVDNINIRSYLPAAPRGLMVSWNISKLPLRNVDVKLIRYTIEYTANFVDEDGTVIGAVPFNIYTSSIQTPTLPAVKGYTVEWESFKLIDDVRYNKTGSYSLTIKAVRTPITYNATFVDKDGKEIAKVPFTVAKHDIKAPEAPVLEGYNVTWPDFKDQILSEEIYEATGSYDFTVKAEYEAIEYTAKFVADGKVVAELPFTVETEALEAPAVPEKTGYTGEWAEYTLEAKDITIEAVYTVVEYKVTFMADGKEVAVLYYTVENKTITEPAVPEKAGFTGEWEEYTLDSGDKVVNAVYTENEPTPEDDTYYITFVDCDGNEIEKIPFTKGTDASTIKAPATVPEKAGYNVYWPSFTLFDDKRFEETGTYSFTVTAVYEAIEYTATFVADGKVIAEITFTVETDSIEAPAIPEKAGYTAVWSSYVLGTEDITIDAIYSTISYKVTFMADGKEVAVLYYTVEDPTIDEPAVPEKEGFKGAWEEYTLDSGDKVVNAVYTEIGGTSGASIFWWIIIGVLVVAAIAAVSVFFVMAKKKKDDEASAENK